MRAIRTTSAVVAAALLVAACGGGGPTSGTSVAVDATSPPATCSEPAAGTAADVDAGVSGNTWGPVTASVGDVITWTNSDAAPHKVALDDGSCTMSANIAGGGGTASLVFNVAGSFPFHCTVHPSMKGTITIS